MTRKSEARVTKTARTRKKSKFVAPVRSRYFPKIGSCSFNFSTSFVSDSKISSQCATRKNATRNYKKIANVQPTKANVVCNKENRNIGYSLLTENRGNQNLNRDGATSNHFLYTPSSAHGSVLSLGPLVYTWIHGSNRDDIRRNCFRRTFSCDRNEIPCTSCSKILVEEAFRHFRDCPVFVEELDSYNFDSEYGANSIPVGGNHPSCVEIIGRWAEEQALRHLCPNQCFLRAFAPSRDWMNLRKSLSCLAPMGDILEDWTCRLVHERRANEDDILIIDPALSPSHGNYYKIGNTTQNQKENRLKSENLLQPRLPRTIFISLKSNESFSSFRKGRKHILKKNDRLTTTKNLLIKDFQSRKSPFDNNYYRDTESKAASPFGLVEELFSEEPWRVLICTMLLNKTQRKQNLDYILFHIFKRWPTAISVVKDADRDEEAVRLFVFSLVRPTGLGCAKAKAFVQLSRDYLLLLASKSKDIDKNKESGVFERVEFRLTRKDVKQLFNCGEYAADAYQIFIRKDFKSLVLSNDHALLAYVEWKRSLVHLT